MSDNKNQRRATLGNRKVDISALRKNIANLNPYVAATLKNTVPVEGDRVTEKDRLGRKGTNIPETKLKKLSDIISKNINSIADLRVITPYIDKAELLWRTILLYPNGKQDRILNYDTSPSSIKSTPLHDVLLPIWVDYFTNDYKIESRLPDIISDVLINSGSYTFFSLSRPGLDYLINGSELSHISGNESFKNRAIEELSKEFISDTSTNKVRVLNKGLFVTSNASNIKQVSGLEGLINDFTPKQEPEFNLLGDLTKDGLEGLEITLTDNPAVLYLQRLNQLKINKRTSNVVGVENLDSIIGDLREEKRNKKKVDTTTINMTDEEAQQLANELYNERNIAKQSTQFVKDNDSLSTQPYGRGITFEPPPEAVIPVIINRGNSMSQDAIILLDEDGNFLKTTQDPDFYQGKVNQDVESKPKPGTNDYIIAGLRKIHSGEPCDFDMSEFAEVVRDNLINKFMGSIISGKGESISITIDEEVNKIFLARMFKKQGVRCLYVPGEAITYITLKRNNLGLGQSLVTSAKPHLARLAAFDIADTLANIEGAQPHNRLNIRLEEHDPDPHQSIATARASYFRSNPRLHDMLAQAQLSIPQIVDAMRESTLTITVDTGENKHIAVPESTIERLDKDNFKPVDDDSRQHALDQIANYLMFPRSWLDITEDGNNFKIEAVTENEIVYNQAVTWAESLSEQLMDAMRKHVRVNATLLKKLVEAIKDNKKLWVPDSKVKLEGEDGAAIKLILTDFLNGIYCEMPTPQSVERTDKIVSSLEAVDKLVNSWVELSAIGDNLERVATMLNITAEHYSPDEIKAKLTAAFKLEAFRRYNLPMPFDDAVTVGNSGIATLVQEIINQHADTAEFLAGLVIGKIESDKKTHKTFAKKLAKAQETYEALNNEIEEEEEENADDGFGTGGGETSAEEEDGGFDETEEDTEEGTEEDTSTEESAEEEDTEVDTEEEESTDGQEDEDYNPFG